MFVTVLEIIVQLLRLVTTNVTQLVKQLHALLLHALRDLNLGSPLHRLGKSVRFFLKADPKDQSDKRRSDKEVEGEGRGILSKDQ